MKTYQDFLALGESKEKKADFLLSAVKLHRQSAEYKTALIAEDYDKKQNTTITKYQKILHTLSGQAVEDVFSSNHKTVSGFFPAFVTQLNQYLLGNGVTLENPSNKEKLGADFDTKLQQAGRLALVEGISFGFWNLDRLEIFSIKEFVPIWDEETGALRAGIRFWQLSADKPLRLTLYDEKGYTEYIKYTDKDLEERAPFRTYRQVVKTDGLGNEEIMDGESYLGFPIIPLYANPHHLSEIVGIRQSIDCYDLVKSGFANDIDDASMIYWTLENTGGMSDMDLARFVQRMKTIHVAPGDVDGGKVESHTMEVPYAAREAMLNRIKSDLYQDFQIINVQELSSGAKTATEIRAAYQPMDNKTDQYEYCILNFLKALFFVVGIEDSPVFTRSRIINQLEETQMVLMAAQYLDDETILNKLPWLTQEEVEDIMSRKVDEEMVRVGLETEGKPPDEPLEE